MLVRHVPKRSVSGIDAPEQLARPRPDRVVTCHHQAGLVAELRVGRSGDQFHALDRVESESAWKTALLCWSLMGWPSITKLVCA